MAKYFKLKPGKAMSVFLAAVFAAAGIAIPFFAYADSYGDKALFSVDKGYDQSGRSQVTAGLSWAGSRIYFYTDDQWWSGLDVSIRQNYINSFKRLDDEFAKNIQPKLTALLGSDANPAVSRDGMLTMLMHPMVKDTGGYINTGDAYSRYQVAGSNERQMVYFNPRFIDSPLAKSYLAHEFTHLITLNQKDILRDVAEEVWLNEARADYSSTFLGYDNPFAGSNFEQRIKSYSADSQKSLVEWLNKPANYGAAHLFIQYLVDQYGFAILSDSMASNLTGIASIDYALKKNGHNIDFSQIFRNWLIATLANDCRLGPQYCYRLADLKGFGITPKINYLPSSDQITLSVAYNTSYFTGNWQKIVGGNGNLSLEFSGDAKAKFKVPYLLCPLSAKECQAGDLAVDPSGKGILKIEDFARQYSSLTLMPFASGKTDGFGSQAANSLGYSFKISIFPRDGGVVLSGESDPRIPALLAQIETLKKEIARVQTILAARVALPADGGSSVPKYSCKMITADLYFGVENYAQVSCLQQVLKNQGPAIYSGSVTGRFSIDTQAAVVRFQEKYAAEILSPRGLKKGTGYVSAATRAKINRLLAQ